MRSSVKRTLWIIVLVAALVAGFLIWRSLTAPDATPPGTGPGTSGGLPVPGGSFPSGTGGAPAGGTSTPAGASGTTPIVGEHPSIERVSDERVFGYWVNSATREIFYLTKTGIVRQVRDGDDATLTTQTFSNLRSLEAAPDRQRALLSFGDLDEPQWGVFDAIDRVWRPLPAGIVEAAWAGKPDHVVAVAAQGVRHDLIDLDLSKPSFGMTTIFSDFNLRDITLRAKNATEILVTERPSAAYSGRAWLLNLATKSVNSLIDPTPGLMLGAAPDSHTLFVSNSPDVFRILDWNFRELAAVFFHTLPPKCTAYASSAYCFVPARYEPNQNPNLPDDYLMGDARSVDRLYAVSYETGRVDVLFESGSGELVKLDAMDPTATSDAVYAVNRTDDFLYRIDLPAPAVR